MIDTGTKAVLPQEIQAFLDTWTGALRARDTDAYAACYTDDVRVFDGMNPPEYKDLEEWKRMIVGWFGDLETEPDLTLEDVRAEVSDDLVVVTSYAGYSDLPKDGTERRVMWCRQTDILRRTDDGWRICHEHSSIPFDMETGKGNFEMQPQGNADGGR